MTEKNKVLLSAEQIIDLAKVQSGILTDLKLIESLLHLMPESGKISVENPLDAIYSKVQDIVRELDETTFILYNIDDQNELEGLGFEFEEE